MSLQNAKLDNSQINTIPPSGARELCSVQSTDIQNNVYSFESCSKCCNMSKQSNTVKTLDINQLNLGKERTLFNANLSKNTADYYALEKPIKRFEIKRDLLEGNYDPAKYRLHFEENTKYVKDVFEIYQSLPTINKMVQSKPQVPVFEQIMVEKNDSAEIKKFIRKVNYDMIGYSCNHNAIDEKVNKVFNNAVNIYKTDEYSEYIMFINLTLIPLILSIISDDKNGKIYNINHETSLSEEEDFDEHYGIKFPTKADIERIVNNIITLNGMVADNNALTNKCCSRCEAAIRKYQYSVFEINRMRDELREQELIDQQYIEKPEENKYDIKAFLQKNFPSINRFPLSDVKNKYKLTFNMTITKDELKKQIEDTKLFRISNVHNVLYVNRI